MTPDVVADVGNTRIKWGRCFRGQVISSVSLPPETTDAWERQLDCWELGPALAWAVAGVAPERRDALVQWLEERGGRVWVASDYRQLPLPVRVNHPERVGIDRLLNAVAALRSWSRCRVPAVLVDAGSAVTVDWLDAAGAFCGGSIFPGLRLMSQALHDYTALLPLVPIANSCPYLPGLSTVQAIEAGVYYAVAGGINTLIHRLAGQGSAEPHIYLTGGDAALLRPGVDDRAELWPEMTLEGIRLSAEAQP